VYYHSSDIQAMNHNYMHRSISLNVNMNAQVIQYTI